MRRHLRNPWVWVAAALLFAVWLFWPRTVNSPAPGETPPAATTSAPAPAAQRGQAFDAAELATIPADLPPEVRATVALIVRGGPFPYHQDGGAFGNREGNLPSRSRGYYREYTVDTPGVSHRGARRIVTGGQPPEVWYYTDDHYESFRSFEVGTPVAGSAGGSAR